MSEWRDISDAPKDKGAILGFAWIGDSRMTRVILWDEDDGEWYCAGSANRFHPTHWMPLPSPPKTQEKVAE